MIIPAIIPNSLSDLKDKLNKVSFADYVQIDVVDGKFVENVSWPYDPIGDPDEIKPELNNLHTEIDLMVADPISSGIAWLEAGARSLIFHLETLEKPEDVLMLKNKYQFNLAFSISNDTHLDTLYPYIDSVDFVQIMGISKIGSQGQPFDSRALDRIASLRALYPEVVISVDGGVNKDTLSNMKLSGANRFVVGSAILNSTDPQSSYEELLKISVRE